jgi:hypothetical protein
MTSEFTKPAELALYFPFILAMFVSSDEHEVKREASSANFLPPREGEKVICDGGTIRQKGFEIIVGAARSDRLQFGANK